jgi:hypothetical protein
MDIGVINTERGGVSYFVNEIERTPTASVFYTVNPVDEVKIRSQGSMIAVLVYAWLKDIIQG